MKETSEDMLSSKDGSGAEAPPAAAAGAAEVPDASVPGRSVHLPKDDDDKSEISDLGDYTIEGLKELVKVMEKRAIKAEQDRKEAEIERNVMAKMLKEAKEKFVEDDAKADDGMIKKIKGFDAKFMVKPEPYDMDPGSFHNWNELFTAYLMSMDEVWEKVLRGLKSVKEPMNKTEIQKFQKDMCFTDEASQSANHSLYVKLLGHTEGKAKA